MGKLKKTKIKLRMKNQVRILAILLFAISIAGCSNGNKNSSQEIENSETYEIDDPVQEQELPKESKLFNDLLSQTQNLNQFEGTAYVGSLDGPCYMVLTSNSQGDNISQLRYQINNYYQGRSDKVDETYTITDLKRKSAKKDGFGLNNTRDFDDIYLYGNVKGLKASINDGTITDGSGSGNIWFVLDSVDYELTYIMASSANWSFQGSIGLEMEQYIKLKELFSNKKLSENEVKSISKSQDLLELSSNDTNFIALGNNKYKVQISKNKLIENSKGGQLNYSYIEPLFTTKIKNISNIQIDKISMNKLYESMPESAYPNASRRSNDKGLNPLHDILEKSTLDWLSQTLSLSEHKEKEVDFIFNLKFNKPGYWFNYPKDDHKRFNDMTIEQILNDSQFLDKWEIISAYPAIKMTIHDAERDQWQEVPVEIYFELVD